MPIDFLFAYDYGPDEQVRKELQDAISVGDLAAVKRLLVGVRTVNFGDTFGSDWSLLHQAAKAGHKDIVQLLLSIGADVRADWYGYTPLHAATSCEHEAIIELFLAKGADINAGDHYQDTPLSYATRNGHVGIVSLLLSHGANVNAKQLDGYTPLHEAAAAGHTNVAKLLLNAGADINAKTIVPPPIDGETPKEYELHELDAARLEGEGFTPLHAAASAGHLNIVRILMVKGANLKAMAMGKYSPARLAGQFGQRPVLEFLKSLKAAG